MAEKDFKAIRRYLHQHPEVSENEYKTSQFIQAKIGEIWPKAEIEKVGECGLVVSQGKGIHIGIRCELDALPINEINDFEYKSVEAGVGHKCGHDGHMTIVLRLAHLLKPIMNKKSVKVSLLFQAAEENGVGAREMIKKSKTLKEYPLDYVFALHNVPSYELNQIVIKNNEFTPSVISVRTFIEGKTSHAAEPWNGINPIYAVNQIVESFKEYGNSEEARLMRLVWTTVYCEVGSESYGTSAGEGLLGLTFRTAQHHDLQKVIRWYQNKVDEIAAKLNVKITLEWFEEFPSIVNHDNACETIRNAAKSLGLSVLEKEEQFSWGEDFGFFTQLAKGAMFGLGAGKDTPALHNPDYDFPDELIDTGSDMFYKIIESVLDD
ncbi:amidohydrolase [Paracrocinitomix mangrovi]|uniref:M20 metallopeptidase family protein n=1 Tax=Paracrocinitomix mangrovi TaxID=2862509 RepID=UPI001C8D751B|nr:amidohydrolase [Paracrocinitomix mangrovi]UKN01396.1 amidohydrolase [Paracrocinitomix mangrovi]